MTYELEYESKTRCVVFKEKPRLPVPLLNQEIAQMNTLISELVGIPAQVPPQPSPENFNKELSKMIKKLYESGVHSFKLNKFEDSAKQFSIAIEIINRRAKFEAFQGTLQELSLLLMSRADAYLKCKHYVKAFNDADLLINMMVCTPDNFLRRGVANYFLGNYEDARADYQRGLAFHEKNERLTKELKICLDKILEETGDFS